MKVGKTYILVKKFLINNNIIPLSLCVLFASASQPMIVLSFAGMSSIFFENIETWKIILYIIVLFVGLFMAWIADHEKTRLTYQGELELRRYCLSSVIGKEIGAFIKQDSGSYYNIIGKNNQSIQTQVFVPFINILSDIVSLMIMSVILLDCSWICLAVIVLFLVPLVINNIVMPKKILGFQAKTMNSLVEMVINLKDILSGFVSLKFQEGERYAEEKLNEYFTDCELLEEKTAQLRNISALIANFSVTLSQFSGLFIAFYMLKLQYITIPEFVLVFQIGMIASRPVIDLINSAISIKSAKPYIDEIGDMAKFEEPYEGFKLDRIDSIKCQDVTFSYNGERDVIKNFSHTFSSGKKYLIIGESGSGKTTFINLLLGILDPTSGGIEYNGINGRDIKNIEKYHHLGVIPQDVYIFNDTIRRNIDLKGEHSDEEIMNIIDKVMLSQLMKANSYSLDTHISNETIRISGGEKARLAIGRMEILNKSVLIFDEVLSSLDADNSRRIEELILSENKCIVIHIAHKSTPEFVDRYDEVIEIGK